MLKRGASDHQRYLSGAFFEAAIAFFSSLHVLPRNLKFMPGKNSGLNGKIAAWVTREFACGSFEVSIHHRQLGEGHFLSSAVTGTYQGLYYGYSLLTTVECSPG